MDKSTRLLVALGVGVVVGLGIRMHETIVALARENWYRDGMMDAIQKMEKGKENDA